MEKYLIAMSGGVDSSVAARLMLDEGKECIGATLVLHGGSEEDLYDAMTVAKALNIPFCSFDACREFNLSVMGDFAQNYAQGRTPNPCVRCNKHMKFGFLLEKAKQLSCSHVVTGHYARVNYDEATGRYLLRRAVDESKDQSYMLATLSQEQLSMVKFPLGELTKAEIRQKAEDFGLHNARKKDSQDICFIPDGDYVGFLTQFTGMQFPEGEFVDKNGKVLGKHKGIIHYTIGQRKGLGISAENPLYVLKISPTDNTVLLGDDSDLYVTECHAHSANMIALPKIDRPLRCKAKIRYRHEPAWCTATQEGEKLHVVFDEPQRAVTPGQSVVLYADDVVLGSGIIK